MAMTFNAATELSRRIAEFQWKKTAFSTEECRFFFTFNREMQRRLQFFAGSYVEKTGVITGQDR